MYTYIQNYNLLKHCKCFLKFTEFGIPLEGQGHFSLNVVCAYLHFSFHYGILLTVCVTDM